MRLIVASCTTQGQCRGCQIILNADRLCDNCPLRNSRPIELAPTQETDPCHNGLNTPRTTKPDSPSE